jgi:hypothetical protein
MIVVCTLDQILNQLFAFVSLKKNTTQTAILTGIIPSQIFVFSKLNINTPTKKKYLQVHRVHHLLANLVDAPFFFERPCL